MFKTFAMSIERRKAIAKYLLNFYVLFAGLLVFADASHKGNYWQMAFGLAAIPNLVALRSCLRGRSQKGAEVIKPPLTCGCANPDRHSDGLGKTPIPQAALN